MQTKYLIFPKTLEKVSPELRSAIDATAQTTGRFPVVTETGLINTISHMRTYGYLEHVPDELALVYEKLKMGSISKLERWYLETPNGVRRIKPTLQDALIVSGGYAHHVLNQESFWDYREQGFSNPFEMFGVIGALLLSKLNPQPYPSITWSPTKSHAYSLDMRATLSGLEIEKTQLVQMTTIDPFGAYVGYRPLIRANWSGIRVHEEGGLDLLNAVLQFVQQTNLQISFLRNPVLQQEFIDQLRAKHKLTGTFSSKQFPTGDLPLNLEWDTPYSVASTDPTILNPYSVYSSRQRTLRFTQHGDREPGLTGNVNLTLTQEDIEPLINGLFELTAEGHFTFSLDGLVDVLNQRFSPKREFQPDLF